MKTSTKTSSIVRSAPTAPRIYSEVRRNLRQEAQACMSAAKAIIVAASVVMIGALSMFGVIVDTAGWTPAIIAAIIGIIIWVVGAVIALAFTVTSANITDEARKLSGQAMSTLPY